MKALCLLVLVLAACGGDLGGGDQSVNISTDQSQGIGAQATPTPLPPACEVCLRLEDDQVEDCLAASGLSLNDCE